MISLLVMLSTAPGFAAEAKPVVCTAVERLYPQLDKTYNHKAPLLAAAGWGRLEQWGPTELDNFRQSVLGCRNKGYLKNLDPAFLAGDLEKKMEELRRESSRIKDDQRILATVQDYQKRVEKIAAHWNNTSAAELRDIKALLPRISGIDDSPYFNKAGDLQNRIDDLLAKPPKATSTTATATYTAEEIAKDTLAKKTDPRGFKKCQELKADYEELVKASASVRQQLAAEKEVEAMRALESKQDDILRQLESASLQMEQRGCKKFL